MSLEIVLEVIQEMGYELCVNTRESDLVFPSIIMTEPEDGVLHCDVVRRVKQGEEPNVVFTKSDQVSPALVHAGI